MQNDLEIHPKLTKFSRELAPHRVGVAELVIPPGSSMIGKSVREERTRAKYGFSLLAIYRGEDVMSHIRTDEHEPTAIGFEPLAGWRHARRPHSLAGAETAGKQP